MCNKYLKIPQSCGWILTLSTLFLIIIFQSGCMKNVGSLTMALPEKLSDKNSGLCMKYLGSSTLNIMAKTVASSSGGPTLAGQLLVLGAKATANLTSGNSAKMAAITKTVIEGEPAYCGEPVQVIEFVKYITVAGLGGYWAMYDYDIQKAEVGSAFSPFSGLIAVELKGDVKDCCGMVKTTAGHGSVFSGVKYDATEKICLDKESCNLIVAEKTTK